MNNTEQHCRNILLLSADTPEELRSIDVYRVMDTANDQGILGEFREWLLSKPLQPKTRGEVEAF